MRGGSEYDRLGCICPDGQTYKRQDDVLLARQNSECTLYSQCQPVTVRGHFGYVFWRERGKGFIVYGRRSIYECLRAHVEGAI